MGMYDVRISSLFLLQIDGLELIFDVNTSESGRVLGKGSSLLFFRTDERTHLSIRLDVREESGRNTPKRTSSISSTLDSSEGLLVDENLVPSSEDATTSQVLHLHTSLSQNASIRNGNRELGSVAQPDVQTREAGLAVEGDEVQIAMEASQDSVERMVLLEVRSSRSQQVRTKTHDASESVLVETEANGSHFSDGEGSSEELGAPGVHDGQEFRHGSRGDGLSIQLSELGGSRARTHAMEEAPLGIRLGGQVSSIGGVLAELSKVREVGSTKRGLGRDERAKEWQTGGGMRAPVDVSVALRKRQELRRSRPVSKASRTLLL